MENTFMMKELNQYKLWYYSSKPLFPVQIKFLLFPWGLFTNSCYAVYYCVIPLFFNLFIFYFYMRYVHKYFFPAASLHSLKAELCLISCPLPSVSYKAKHMVGRKSWIEGLWYHGAFQDGAWHCTMTVDVIPWWDSQIYRIYGKTLAIYAETAIDPYKPIYYWSTLFSILKSQNHKIM